MHFDGDGLGSLHCRVRDESWADVGSGGRTCWRHRYVKKTTPKGDICKNTTRFK